MKFYRIQSGGRDIGRLMLDPQGIGKLQLDGHQRPLDIMEKLPGEPWGYVHADQCQRCGGSGIATDKGYTYNEEEYPCPMCEHGSKKDKSTATNVNCTGIKEGQNGLIM